MKSQSIKGMTRDLGKPEGYDEALHGKCSSLPIRDEEINGLQMMTSEWKPTPEELRKIVAGGSIFLSVNGRIHPVVAMYVGTP